ncbi:hypothetical protein AGMMS49992_21460 [Clostridia bacterium]|nr:hypothetical protein AGMMS49992_21460 [Clostridia bacterium]
MATSIFTFTNNITNNRTIYLSLPTTNGSTIAVPLTSGTVIPTNAVISNIALSTTGTMPDSIDNPTNSSFAFFNGSAAIMQGVPVPPRAKPAVTVAISSSYYTVWRGVSTLSLQFRQTTAPRSSTLALFQKSSSTVAFVVSFTITWTQPTTAVGAPTSVALSQSLAETVPSLSWNGAVSGSSNTITAYRIEYADSADGSTWGAWSFLQQVATTATSGTITVALPTIRGYYRKNRVRTEGSAGASYYSGWVESSSVRYNQLPLPPTGVTMSATIQELTISWSGGSDPDNNLAGTSIKVLLGATQEWFDVGTLTGSSIVIAIPDGFPSQTLMARLWSVDAFGAISSTYLDSVPILYQVGSPPSVPIVTLPSSNAITHNARPRLLVQMGEGDTDASIIADGWTPSRAAPIIPEANVVLQLTQPLESGETVSASIAAVNDFGQSETVSRTILYEPLIWTDETLVPNVTLIKAIHMNELRAAFGTARAYYGLPSFVWFQSIVSKVTLKNHWPTHVAELCSAIEEVIQVINVYDVDSTANDVLLPVWINSFGQRPSVNAVNQLRAVVCEL